MSHWSPPPLGESGAPTVGGLRSRRVLVPAGIVAGVVLALVVGLALFGIPPFSGDEASRQGPPSASSPSVSSPSVSSPSASAPDRSGATVGGWYAGASGLGVTDGAFARWLGQPVTVAAVWADQDDHAQRTLPALSKGYQDWAGALDIAVGGTVLGSDENYAAAARGAYDDRWRAAAAVLADGRRDAAHPTFVRPFHEMNGNWYENWMVTRENSDDFKRAFARYVRILREAMPSVYISWSPNFGDHTGLPVDLWYPGDDVVDCVAPDYYDDGASDARVDVEAWNDEADDRDALGNPKGPEAWRQFAATRGKPICFPEWGLKPEGKGVDHPEWIKAFNAWMNEHANTATWTLGEDIPQAATGKVLYSVYFNVVHQGNPEFTVHGTGANPRSAAVFPRLPWGNRT